MQDKALNSITSKIRAKYGKMLKETDYKQLSCSSSVSEIASYLRTRTKFSDVLSGINDSAVHRGHLEEILKEQRMTEKASICRFERSVGDEMFKFTVRREEADTLLDFLRLLYAGNNEREIPKIPYILKKYSGIDFGKIYTIGSIAELKTFLTETEFRSAALLLNDDGTTDFDIIETAFERIVYQTAFKSIDTYSDDNAKKELKAMLTLSAELSDCSVVIRAKRYYDAAPDEIRPDLLRYHYILSPKTFEKMVVSDSAENAEEIFKNSPYSRYIDRFKTNDPDRLKPYMLHEAASHNIHFSSSPPVVMMSYFTELDIETDNLIKIIEGVRYKLSQDKILDSIILRTEGK